MKKISKKFTKLLYKILPECRLKTNIKNKLNNNKFILIKNGKTILNPKIKGLEVNFLSSNGTIILHYPINRIENLKLFVGQNSKIEIGESKYYFVDSLISASAENSSVTIGKNFSMNKGCSIICDFEPNLSISVGDECMFAPKVWMRTSDGHSIYSTITQERLNKGKNIKIGNHVWLLSRTAVTKGVELCDNIIAGTNSVITKSFNQEYIMIGGIPAKIVRENITWDRKI